MRAGDDVRPSPEILDQPGEVPVAMHAEQFRPQICDVVLGRSVVDAKC